MNGSLHLGHAFTISKVSFHCWKFSHTQRLTMASLQIEFATGFESVQELLLLHRLLWKLTKRWSTDA